MCGGRRGSAGPTHRAARAPEVDVASDHEELGGGSKTHVKESQLPDTLSTSRNLMMRDDAPHGETLGAYSGCIARRMRSTSHSARAADTRGPGGAPASRLCRMTDSLISSAYTQALEVIGAVEPRIADATRQELADQRGSLKLIASRELRLPGRAADHGHLVLRQVRRGHRRAPLLRRLPERRHGRVAGGRARPRAVRRAVRLCAAALGHRRQPRRLLVDPGQPGGVALPAEDAGQERQRADRGRLGDAARRARQPAPARHVASTPAATSPTASAPTSAARCSTSSSTAPTRRPACSTTTRSLRRPASSSRWCSSPATRRTRAG